MVRYPLPGKERLKKTGEITAVFKSGHSVACSGALLFFRRNNLSYNRIAHVFSRKFGNAVKRNRARRLGREAYRRLRPALNTGYDMVLLVYPDNKADFSRRLDQLGRLLKQARIMDANYAA